MTTATKERKAKATTFSADAIKSAMASVIKVVPTKAPKPVVQNVLLQDGRMAATNLETRVDMEIAYHGEGVLIPAHRFKSILDASVGDEVSLRRDGALCIIKIGTGEWRLPTEDVLEYPNWEPEGTRLVCRLPADQFHRAITSVVYAADDESSRYALGCVCIEVSRKDGKVYFVATDGRRLSVAQASLGSAQDPDSSESLIPVSAALLASSLCSNDGEVEIQTNGRDVVFNLDGATVTARQVDGKFPRWRDVFPNRPDSTKHIVGLKVLHGVTKAASVVTSEQSKGVSYTFVDSCLTLTAKSSEKGESKVSCDVEEYGRDATVKLDPHFVSDMCKAFESLQGEPTISVTLGGPGDAVVFNYGGDNEYRSVIMPLSND